MEKESRTTRAAVRKHRLGFYELADKPTQEELEAYYAQSYYQQPKGAYQPEYSPEEIAFINNKIEQKLSIIRRHLNHPANKPLSLLDVGCGEGWVLAYFKAQGWDVTGLDYSDFGCRHFNPQVADSLVVGDIYASLDRLKGTGQRFTAIWLNNVLEHVLEPDKLLRDLRPLAGEQGFLVVLVPNDFSVIQEYLLDKGHISEPFWVVSPDHISYFTAESLERICEAAGWKKLTILGDHPIDFNLLNPNTNYARDRSVGRSCHLARVEIENLLHGISVEKTIAYYESLADLGLGRAVTGVFAAGNPG